ncbi:MAG: sigma-70 family RNA polymerase sigma factor [Gemmataceae bacterium]
MGDREPEATSATLLGKLRNQPNDGVAWQEFVRRYRPAILAFCRTYSLQAADAEDVTQIVFAKLTVKIRKFHYDPTRSFRAWLKTVTHHALLDYLDERRPDRGSGDSDVLRLLQNVEAREELVRQLESAYDQELLEEALRRVRPQVPPRQWDAFRLTTLEGLSGADTAARLGMLVATVYSAKCKVQQRVREEIQRLEGCTDQTVNEV